VLDSGSDRVIRIEADLDAVTAPLIFEDVKAQVAGVSSLTLDCSRVAFCDSAGIRCLMLIRREVAPDVTVTLSRANEMIHRLLHITGLQSQFDLRQG
jgi:anti-anti-sigma factor